MVYSQAFINALKYFFMKIGNQKLIYILTFILCFTSAFADEASDAKNYASINGFVRDKETGETLIGASVYFKDIQVGARTNKNGYYTINNVLPGEHTLVVTYIGYESFEKKIKVKANDVLRMNIEILPSSIRGEEVIVSADRESEKREITLSRVDVPIQQIKDIRIGGESDLFRALQYLPGILTSSQISSGLYVRGGSPDQNLILLDGSTVYNPSHLFGFFSTFNTDAIKDVELIKGGFNAEYGGRISSVLSITQNDGNQKEFQGLGSIGAISSRVSLQGPVLKGSWSISARRTYLELVKEFIKEDPRSPLPDFGFYDINAKVVQNLSDNDKLSFTGFLTSDDFKYSGAGFDANMNMKNYLGGISWTHIYGKSLFSNLNFNYTNYSNSLFGNQSGYSVLFDNSIDDYTLKANFEWLVNENATIKFGYQTSILNFGIIQNFSGNIDTSYFGTSASTSTINIKNWNHSLFAQANYQPTDLISMQGGIRTDYWNLTDKVTIDPRFSIRYLLQENMSLKFGWGIYHQNIRTISDPNFTFFDIWIPSDSTVPITQAIHYILSLETNPFKGIALNFDVYYKTLTNISQMNQTALQGTTAREVLYVGNGRAYGFEIFAQKKYGKLTGWFGYALGVIKYKFDSLNYGQEFNPKFDRTHDLKLVLNYTINNKFSVGSSFLFQSGQPYTGATSRVQLRLPGQNYGRSKVINSGLYELRLPPSHQLNLNGSYYFKTFGLESIFTLDIYNVYSHRDILSRYYNVSEDNVKVEDIRLLPIIPSISYEIKF
ncbi:MAG TPA: hypothetical protein DCW42_08315 [Bacteroidetes bacterium]|nr:hypothetical protein [Bacteroidota bacterium]